MCRYRHYVHSGDIGKVEEYWLVRPESMTGLRQWSDEPVIMLEFGSVMTETEDRTVAHFNLAGLPASVPYTELHIPLHNLDEGGLAGTFDVYVFEGDGNVSINEWNAGTLHRSFNSVENPGALILDITQVLQSAIDSDAPYLSFRFTGGTGSDRYNLGDTLTINGTVPYASLQLFHSDSSFWKDHGIYSGAAPVSAYGEILWHINSGAAVRNWVDANRYTDCLGARPTAP